MNKHLDKYLCEKYPKIFANRGKSPQETCMCWGFPGDGWFLILDRACGLIQHHLDNPRWVEKRDVFTRLKKLWNATAWNWFIYPLSSLIIKGEKPSKTQWKVYGRFVKWFSFDIRYEKPKNSPSQLVADQVKEKFGTLRFYYHGGDEYTQAIVDFAASLSCYTCEDCGAMDETVGRNSRGWIRTTCEKCTSKEILADHKKNRNKERVNVIQKARTSPKEDSFVEAMKVVKKFKK